MSRVTFHAAAIGSIFAGAIIQTHSLGFDLAVGVGTALVIAGLYLTFVAGVEAVKLGVQYLLTPS